MPPMTKTEQLIRIKNEFRATHDNAPASARSILDWAIETGRYVLDMGKAKRAAAEELAAALRSEHATDAHGNEIRVNLAFSTDQGWLWDQRETISRSHMEINSMHTRRMVYSDIRAAVLSVNDYNERHPDEAPIQFSLNFAADLADDGISLPDSISVEQIMSQSLSVPSTLVAPGGLARPAGLADAARRQRGTPSRAVHPKSSGSQPESTLSAPDA